MKWAMDSKGKIVWETGMSLKKTVKP
jgi:hypothetical protein